MRVIITSWLVDYAPWMAQSPGVLLQVYHHIEIPELLKNNHIQMQYSPYTVGVQSACLTIFCPHERADLWGSNIERFGCPGQWKFWGDIVNWHPLTPCIPNAGHFAASQLDYTCAAFNLSGWCKPWFRTRAVRWAVCLWVLQRLALSHYFTFPPAYDRPES